jgi:ELWxxDGT repeat protein
MNPTSGSFALLTLLVPALTPAQAPAVLLRDIRPGSPGTSITGYAEMQGKLYFTAQTGALSTSFDMFVTDGTPAGTVPLGVMALAQVHNGPPVAVGNQIYFLAATTAAGLEVWKSDGTLSGTGMVADLNPGPTNASADLLTSWRGYCWFFASAPVSAYRGLWRSDGTAAGTVRVGPDWGTTRRPIVAGGKLFFVAFDPTFGDELWVLDDPLGTPRMVLDIRSGAQGSTIDELVEWRNQVYFNANDGVNGFELWKSDGTATNTVLVADVNPGPGSARPAIFTPTRDYLFFQNGEPIMAGPIWQTDGTQAGTQMIPHTPRLLGFPSWTAMVRLGNTVYARAYLQGSPEVDLWKFDGSPSGTQRVRSTNQSRALTPQRLCPVGSRYVYFMGDDGATGNEVWRSDGTQTGTTLVADVMPGPATSSPINLRPLGGQLVFWAATPATGPEPFAVPLDAHGQAVGVACGAPGRATTLAATDPVLGQTCTLAGRDVYTGSSGYLFLGLPAATPIALPIGGPSCRLLISPALFAPLATVAPIGNTWSLALPIPNDPAFQRVLLRVQGAFAPTNAPGGLDLTNAGNLNLGR